MLEDDQSSIRRVKALFAWFSAVGLLVAGGSLAMLRVLTRDSLVISGTIEPLREYSIVASVSAHVEELYALDGAYVEANDKLVRLRVPSAEQEMLDAVSLLAGVEREMELSRRRHLQDSADSERRLAVATAQLEEAKARLVETLVDFGANSPDGTTVDSMGGTRLRQARALVAKSEAELRHAQGAKAISSSLDSLFLLSRRSAVERLQLARVKVTDVVVRSPFSGILVLSPTARSPDASVSAGERLGSVLDTSCWQVHANVPDAWIGSIHVGDSVRARILAHPDSTPISGVVADIRLQEVQEKLDKRLVLRARVQLDCLGASRRHIGPGLPVELRLPNSSGARLRILP